MRTTLDHLSTASAPGRCTRSWAAIADLPGVDPDSVDVSVDGGILTVTAQRSEHTEHGVQWLSSERFIHRHAAIAGIASRPASVFHPSFHASSP